MKTVNDFLDTFAITPPQLEQLSSRALSKGGDFCDLYFEYTTYMSLLLKDGEVTSGGSHTDYGVGIRVLKGEKTGYAYILRVRNRSENPSVRSSLPHPRCSTYSLLPSS